tara:strand:- start:3559 stop:4206 length:648 start_codon:yes stop_codon:yes gene_type:complete
MLKILYNQNKWLVFGGITIVALYFTWLMNAALPFERMTYNSLSEQLSANRIHELLESQQKWKWLGYLFVPVLLLIKWALVAITLDVGALFLEIELKFKKAFQIAMLSEVAFIILLATKFGWFFYHREILTLEYVQFFMPLSLGNIIDISSIDKWFVYPLQAFNAFEFIYWLVLAYFLSLEIKQTFWKSFHFVILTYGLGLVIWLIFIAFLILNFS